MNAPLHFVVLGVPVTSSRGSAHAGIWGGLLRELTRLGHSVLFLEREVRRYAPGRILRQDADFCRTDVYTSLGELQRRFASVVRDADVVIVASHIPEGAAVGEWVVRTAQGVTAFYDFDTPFTLAKLDEGDCAYISPRLVQQYQLYLSLAGGPALARIEEDYGSPSARALYASVDSTCFFPEPRDPVWDFGYLAAYDDSSHPTVERLLNDTARRWGGGRFVVAGPQISDRVQWPANVERIERLSPVQHRAFYCSQRFTLDVTPATMIESGFSPGVRLFEAAACGTPVISDRWDGLETLFAPGTEILLPRSAREVLEMLVDITERERIAIGARARARVLQHHTAAHRALELLAHIDGARTLLPAV